jgi:hypothetical protein
MINFQIDETRSGYHMGGVSEIGRSHEYGQFSSIEEALGYAADRDASAPVYLHTDAKRWTRIK